MAWQVQKTSAMPAIDRLMKRLGYVKLSSYGLVLTPEGRVLSMRPAALDDGLGGRVVGWQEGDLAAMELAKWEPARPAPAAAVATRVAAPPRPVVPARPPAPPRAAAPAPALAPEPVVEEDDWEWTIAIARARAAAEDVGAVAAELKPDPISADAWPKTEPLSELDYNDYTSPMTEVVRIARLAHTPRVVLPAKAAPEPPRAHPRATSPVTVIPVPKLPTVANPNPRAMAIPSIVPPRRIAKGTGPYLPKAPVEPPHDDDTVPGMILPPELPRVARAQRG